MIDPNLFPKVFIRSVDLDIERSDYERNTNPHVNDKNIIYDNTGIVAGPAYIQLRPDSKINKTTDVLTIDVELTFETGQSDAVVADFLDKEFVNKYLRIRVVLSDDPGTTRKIIEDFNNLSSTNIDNIAQQGLVNVTTKTLLDVDFETDINEDIQNNVIRANFRHKTIEPQHLSILAFSYFDLLEIERDLNLDISTNKELKSASSILVIENIFVDGNVVSESFIFRERNGSIWSGPVGVQGDEYFKYGTSIPLTEERIPNSVVNDFRPYNALLKSNAELDKLNDTLAEKFDTTSVHNRTQNKKMQLFSDLCLTQDEDANARLAFGINYKSALVNKGKYGFLFKDRDIYREAEIYKQSKILDLSVYRQRVERIPRSNALGAMIEDIEYFNNVEEKVLIANNSERKYDTFSKKEFYSINNTSGDLAGIIREIKTNFKDIRMFSASDEELDKVTDGLYTYYIEAEIQDGTIFFVNNLYEETRQIQTFLTDYVYQIESPGNYNPSTGKLTSTFIARLQAQNFPWLRKSLDLIANLSFMFQDLSPNLFTTIKSGLNPQTASLRSLQVLSRLVNKFLIYLEREFVDNSFIRNFSSSTNSQAINRRNNSDYAVIKISRQYEAPVVDSNLIKHKGMEFIEFQDNEGITTYDNFDGLAAISIQKFTERADNETSKYFNNSTVPIDMNIGNREYFSRGTTDDNKFAYFSVSKIKTDRDTSDYFNEINSFDAIKTSMLEFSADGNNFKTNLDSITADNINKQDYVFKENGSKFMKMMGVTVEGNAEAILGKTVDRDTILRGEDFAKADSTTDTTSDNKTQATYAAFKSIYNIQKKSAGLTLTKEDRTKLLKNKDRKLGFMYDMKSSLNVVDSTAQTRVSLDAIPNQQKSILMGSVKNTNVNPNVFVNIEEGKISDITEDFDAAFSINYKNLIKIEALVGYEEIRGLQQARAPIWQTLNRTVLDSYEGKELVCRSVRYNNPMFASDKQDVFEKLPIYNEYFIILLDKEIKHPTLEAFKGNAMKQHSTRQVRDSQTRSNTGVYMQPKTDSTTNPIVRDENAKSQRGSRVDE